MSVVAGMCARVDGCCADEVFLEIAKLKFAGEGGPAIELYCGNGGKGEAVDECGELDCVGHVCER